ncbi:MAG: hypothetical protein P0116_14520 [Candidatus Nitrosocosmicus sp.]|nr:hypothetical protein [Candidatus Nitrosocosmicus sp.]
MQELRFFMIMLCTFVVLGILIGHPAISIVNATTSSLPSTSSPQQESTDFSDGINDSALANLSQALQEDKEDGDQNGGENWDKAINNLEDEMGFPVDEDVEEALMNITEVHLNNLSIQ